MQTKPTVYHGAPHTCDICDEPFESVMYDAATRRGWGYLCPDCFAVHGLGIGTGVGQRYKLTDGQWIKTAG